MPAPRMPAIGPIPRPVTAIPRATPNGVTPGASAVRSARTAADTEVVLLVIVCELMGASVRDLAPATLTVSSRERGGFETTDDLGPIAARGLSAYGSEHRLRTGHADVVRAHRL